MLEILLLVAIIVALMFTVGGFFLHVLWIVAVVLAVVWLAGMVLGRGRRSRL